MNLKSSLTALALLTAPLVTTQTAQAHCDSMDGPSIPATDKALASGEVEPVLKLITEKTEEGLRKHFQKTLTKKKFDKTNVQAGRDFVKAYVEYTHYAKRIYDAAAREAVEHSP